MSTLLEQGFVDSETPGMHALELKRVMESETFLRAPRLSSLLRYICERSSEQRYLELTEQQIGIYVFHRAPGYNSAEDTIVRGNVRHLRQRLATYYLGEGAQNPLRIEIPKGSYIAQFKVQSTFAQTDADAKPEALSSSLDTESVEEKRDQRWWLMPAACVCVLLSGGFLWAHMLAARTPSDLLWQTLFTRDRKTLIVPGDAGLNLFEVTERRGVDLQQYTRQEFLQYATQASETPSNNVGNLAYTTISDLQLTNKLIRLPQADSDRTEVRYSRDLTAHDLPKANLILMGSPSFNPWVLAFQSGLTFNFHWDPVSNVFTITNNAPLAHELPAYVWSPHNSVKQGFTLVTLTNNPQGSGRVLLIEGMTTGGIFAGVNFLFDSQLLDPVLQKAKRPDGSLKNFEILLRSDFVREGATNVQPIAVHYH